MGEALTSRERHVLKFLVELYIKMGRPVGSRLLARVCGLGLSPATIRNTVAELEGKGFVYAPHTSAGRIPTAKGYRYFIDQLLTPEELEGEIVERLWRDLERQSSPRQLLEAACHFLARLTHLVGVATLPSPQELLLERLELLPLEAPPGKGRLLVLLILSDGEVISEVVPLEEPLGGQALAHLELQLNRLFQGHPLAEIAEIAGRLREKLELLQRLKEIVATALKRRTLLAGEVHLFDLAQPSEQLRLLYRSLRERWLLEEILSELDTDRPAVFLGEELKTPLRSWSVVVQGYPKGGVIGVVGPVRMDYARILPLVETTARLIGRALKTPPVSP